MRCFNNFNPPPPRFSLSLLEYLKSANVLLVAASSSENNLRAKITDFGFTQLRVSANNSTRLAMTHLGGTLLYQAPELIQSNKYTASCDVYSYGVIFLELITLLHPVEALSDFQDKLQTAVDRNQLPVFFKELPLKCLSYKPSERPPFTEIYNELDRHTLNPVNDKTPPKQQPQPPIFEIQKPSFTEYRYNHKSRPSTSAYILSGVSSMLKTNVSSTWEHDISRSNNIQYSSTLASTSKQENIRHSMLPRNKRKYALVLAFIALLIAIVSVAYVLVLKLRSTPSTSQSSANNINDAVSSSSSTYSSSSASPTFTTISTSTSTSSPAASLIDSRGYCIQCSNTGVEAMFSGDSSSSILAGQSINLTNGIRFTQQSDGNLILYAADGKTQIFSSNTMGMGNNFWSQMQSDGNFVVKVDGNTAVMNTWTGNQPRDGRFCMAILPQGDLAIYSNFNCANPLWQASRGINGNPNCYATWCSYNYNGVLIRY